MPEIVRGGCICYHAGRWLEAGNLDERRPESGLKFRKGSSARRRGWLRPMPPLFPSTCSAYRQATLSVMKTAEALPLVEVIIFQLPLYNSAVPEVFEAVQKIFVGIPIKRIVPRGQSKLLNAPP